MIQRERILDRYDLISPTWESAFAKILGYGAQKYGDTAYLTNPFPGDTHPENHIRTHLNAYLLGKPYDIKEIGTDPKLHLVAVAVNCMMLWDMIETSKELAQSFDDLSFDDQLTELELPQQPFTEQELEAVKLPESQQEAQQTTENLTNTTPMQKFLNMFRLDMRKGGTE